MGYDATTLGGRPKGRVSARLMAALRRSILSWKEGAGGYLPSVRQISREQRLSCKTVHSVLRSLAAEGLLAAEPSRGYRILYRANDPRKGCPLAYVLSRENIVDSWDLLYRRIGQALETSAGRRGWPVVGLVSGQGQEPQLVEQLTQLRASGLILDTHNAEMVRRVGQLGLPAVMVDAWSPENALDVVVQDNFGGGAAAAGHLVKGGHRRIAWFGPVGESRHSRERYGGAAAALKSEGLEFSHQDEAALEPAPAEAARRLLAGRGRPTGVLALWRPAAAALLQAAGELGLAAGRDFEMVGWCAAELYRKGFLDLFDGKPAAPAVVWSTAVMADAAIDRLAERRARPDMAVVQIRIPTRLRLPGSAE